MGQQGAAAGPQPADRANRDGHTAGDHRAGQRSKIGGRQQLAWAGKGARACSSQSIHSLSSASMRNCLPSSWRRASGGLPRETPSSADGPATHPGPDARAKLRLVTGSKGGSLDKSGRAAGASGNWPPLLLFLRSSGWGPLTGAGGAPDRNRPRTRWNLKASPRRTSRMASR